MSHLIKTYVLTPKSWLTDLTCYQEETDTCVVLYLKYAAQRGYKSAVVRTSDSDIFFILLHHAQTIPLTIYIYTGVGHRKIVNVSELAETKGDALCTTILGLYVFTGKMLHVPFRGKGRLDH